MYQFSKLEDYNEECMVVKHLRKLNVTKPFNSKSLLFRTKYLSLLLHYETTIGVQVYNLFHSNLLAGGPRDWIAQGLRIHPLCVY
jgi:hypothetical protein